MKKGFPVSAAVLAAASLAPMAGCSTSSAVGDPSRELSINGRKMEIFQQDSKSEWGYPKPQRDTFIVVHPKNGPKKKVPLYVVLHSAGHDVYSTLKCITKRGNHDIYHSPSGFYALYLDCRANPGDWWWGGLRYRERITKNNKNRLGVEPTPVEKRVVDTVRWMMKHYPVDPDRVYLSGNSMGGSGALGIGLNHGDLFAAVKANVPAGVEHACARLALPPEKLPAGVKLPDPPVCIDYSAQNDSWSRGHERFLSGMNARKYALYFYWAPFGHANNDHVILKQNDLVHSLDWLNIRKNEAYPVFTDASTNDRHPWPGDLKSGSAGQINAFFRWKNISDAPDRFEMSLFLAGNLKTRFPVPAESTADVTLRRCQKFKLKPGERIAWTFGKTNGICKADENGIVTIPRLKITAEPVSLVLQRTP